MPDAAQAAAARPAAVEATSVSVSYWARRSRVDAVSDVTFAVRPGEIVALTGPSGAGKSSLLFAIAGLLRPQRGSILVDGVDVAALGESDAAVHRLRTAGMVFQFFHLLPALDAIDNVALPLQLTGVPRAEARERASAALAELGLGDRARHLPRQLSGGEQQRVAVARAVITDPPLVLADEPTGNLDTDSAALVARLLYDVTGGRRTLIVATHDERIIGGATRVLRLEGGRLAPGTRGEGQPA
jgi:putative ABC transport system ATP-binding protein